MLFYLLHHLHLWIMKAFIYIIYDNAKLIHLYILIAFSILELSDPFIVSKYIIKSLINDQTGYLNVAGRFCSKKKWPTHANE